MIDEISHVPRLFAGNTRPTSVPRQRQSRLGLAWLVGCLFVAAWTAFGGSVLPRRPAARGVAASPAAITKSPVIRLKMKPIQDYRVGERILAHNPLGGEEEPEPDPESWKSVDLRMRKPSGKYVTMTLLLSPERIAELGVGYSRTVELDLPEMGVSGRAEVLDINPCPQIEAGPGSVVTGTFMHESEGNLINLYVEGLEKPLGVTDNHPFFSADRGEFVAARDLRSGEQVSDFSEGRTARILSHERRGDELVYNLQVNGQHVYHVGEHGILVHNSCLNLGGRFADLNRLKVAGEVAHHMPQNAAGIVSRTNGPAIGMTIADHELTRTFRWKGIGTNRADAALTPMQRLMKDIEDIRELFGDKYERAIQQMLEYARGLPEFQ